MEQNINQIIWERLRQDNYNRLMNASNLMQIGNGHGYYEMAKRHANGWCVEIKPDLALSYYRTAAEKGHAGACVELAKLYLQGDKLSHLKQDIDLAKYFATLGANTNEDLFSSIEGYDQKMLISEAKTLLQVVEYVKSTQENSFKLNY